MSNPPKDQASLLGSDPPRYRPRERFWPYVDLPEQLTDEEIAALDPDLHAELFGAPPRPLSITVVFPELDSSDYARAVELAKASAEYRESGSGSEFRHRARYWPADAVKLRDLFEIVGRFDQTEVLVDDRPVPYARELWLPLIWFLIPR
jgi:phenylpyruvate tautomerase PptA (4-oxalocrotonate tautomerase family)